MFGSCQKLGLGPRVPFALHNNTSWRDVKKGDCIWFAWSNNTTVIKCNLVLVLPLLHVQMSKQFCFRQSGFLIFLSDKRRLFSVKVLQFIVFKSPKSRSCHEIITDCHVPFFRPGYWTNIRFVDPRENIRLADPQGIKALPTKLSPFLTAWRLWRRQFFTLWSLLLTRFSWSVVAKTK